MRFDEPEGDNKTFRPFHYGDAGWALGDPPGELPLYGLPKLAGVRRVYVVV